VDRVLRRLRAGVRPAKASSLRGSVPALRAVRARHPERDLAAYAFIEPRSFSAPGYPANDQHPPHDLLEGEKLIAEVYDTLRADDKLWRQSLMVVLYDEHGGFYDHVPPPRAVPPDSSRARPSGFNSIAWASGSGDSHLRHGSRRAGSITRYDHTFGAGDDSRRCSGYRDS